MINGGVLRHAAVSAGYAVKSASSTANRLMKLPHIKAEIMQVEERKRAKDDIAAVVNRDWLLRQWVKVYDRCMAAEPMLNGDGEETGEFRWNATGANKSLEHLAKSIGMFEQAGSAGGGTQGLQINILNYKPDQTDQPAMAPVVSVEVSELSSQGDSEPLPAPKPPPDMGEIVDIEPIEVLIDEPT